MHTALLLIITVNDLLKAPMIGPRGLIEAICYNILPTCQLLPPTHVTIDIVSGSGINGMSIYGQTFSGMLCILYTKVSVQFWPFVHV